MLSALLDSVACLLQWAEPLSNASAAAKEVDYQNNRGDHQQQVNQSAANVGNQAQKP
jgi:hypothetical protein